MTVRALAIVAVVALVGSAFLVVTASLLVWPRAGSLHAAEAVVVLGPAAAPGRLAKGLAVVGQVWLGCS